MNSKEKIAKTCNLIQNEKEDISVFQIEEMQYQSPNSEDITQNKCKKYNTIQIIDKQFNMCKDPSQ